MASFTPCQKSLGSVNAHTLSAGDLSLNLDCARVIVSNLCEVDEIDEAKAIPFQDRGVGSTYLGLGNVDDQTSESLMTVIWLLCLMIYPPSSPVSGLP